MKKTIKILDVLKSRCLLHRVHECPLYLVEDDHAEGDEDCHEGEAVGYPAPADELARA